MRRVVLPLFVVLGLCLSGVCRGEGGVLATNGTRPESVPEAEDWGEILIRHVQTYDFPDPVFVFELQSVNRFYGLRFETNIGDGDLEDYLGGARVNHVKIIEIRCRKTVGQGCSPKNVVIRKATAESKWIGESVSDVVGPVDITPLLRTDPRETRRFEIFKKGPLPPAVVDGNLKNAGKGGLLKNKQQILVYHEGLNAPLQNDYVVRLTFSPGQAKRYKKIFLLSSEGPSSHYSAEFDKKQPSVWHGRLAWENGGSSYRGLDPVSGKGRGGFYRVDGVSYDAYDGSIAYSEEKPAPFPWITLYQVTGWTKGGRKVDLLPFLVEDPFTPLPLELEGKGPLPVVRSGD